MRIRQARKILRAWGNYQYMNGRSVAMIGKVFVAVKTRTSRTRRRRKRLNQDAWIRQLKRLSQRPWMIDAQVNLGTLPTFDEPPMNRTFVTEFDFEPQLMYLNRQKIVLVPLRAQATESD